MDLNSQLEEANRTIAGQKQRLKEQISAIETQVSHSITDSGTKTRIMPNFSRYIPVSPNHSQYNQIYFVMKFVRVQHRKVDNYIHVSNVSGCLKY